MNARGRTQWLSVLASRKSPPRWGWARIINLPICSAMARWVSREQGQRRGCPARNCSQGSTYSTAAAPHGWLLGAATLRRTWCFEYHKLWHGRIDVAHHKRNEATGSRRLDLDRHWLGVQRGNGGTIRSLRLGTLGDLTSVGCPCREPVISMRPFEMH
jgi:hypothetical protein